MNEYQQEVLKILLEIDRICRKNNIQYALAYGSALGAVNFKGFIPWDWDADVIMTQQNWDKFVIACRKDLNDYFVLDCYENDPMYDVFLPMELRTKNSRIKEKFISECLSSHTKNRGIYVDIQIFCGVEEKYTDYLATQKKFALKKLFSVPFKAFKSKKFKDKIKRLENSYIAAHSASTMWDQRPTTGSAWFTTRFKSSSYPKDCIFPFRTCIFEGHEFYIVNKPEEFCILNYGPACLFPEKYPESNKKPAIKSYKIYTTVPEDDK